MNAPTINTSTFELRDASNALVPATVTYNASTFVATLTPSSALATSTTYTATVKGGATDPRAKDVAGNALAANVSWSFTTAAAADTTPPTVTTTTPASGATNVTTSTTVTAAFSEAMNASTITTSTFQLRNPAGTLVTATVAYNATTRVATLTPSSALTGGPTTYTATVVGGTNGVKDLAGNSLASNQTWSFTTADTTPPTVSAVSPASGATGVSLATTVSATFSEAMNAATITATTFVLKNPSGTTVAATVAYNATTRVATLTPMSPLTGGPTTYTATVVGGTSGVKDQAGNPLAANRTWSFTTIDTTPPTVQSTSPSNNATGVSLNGAVTVTFSEGMTASTITAAGAIVMKNSAGTGVLATVTYAASQRTATIKPNSSLANRTTYTVTVKGGSTGVKDAAGNAMVSDYVFSFTTR
jgi:hypothetical protein